jgi:phosphoglycolate phosphatase-like HAD superfamily hydrolase
MSPARAAEGGSAHIIWDWNGTVLNDSAEMIASVICAFTKAGLRPVTVDDHQRHFCRPITDFFDRLAGRRLTAAEHVHLRSLFDLAYAERFPAIQLAPGMRSVMQQWQQLGGTQSLLSMCPHDDLVLAVQKSGLADRFSLIDGYRGSGPDTKAHHLKRHLAAIAPSPSAVVMVGDTADDADAAAACGIDFVLYHSGPNSLQALDHFESLGIPIARTMHDALQYAMRSLRHQRDEERSATYSLGERQ